MSTHGITIDHSGHIEPHVRRPDPSPSEIAAGCAAIRETWSDHERQKRIVETTGRVETLVVTTPEIGE